MPLYMSKLLRSAFSPLLPPPPPRGGGGGGGVLTVVLCGTEIFSVSCALRIFVKFPLKYYFFLFFFSHLFTTIQLVCVFVIHIRLSIFV